MKTNRLSPFIKFYYIYFVVHRNLIKSDGENAALADAYYKITSGD